MDPKNTLNSSNDAMIEGDVFDETKFINGSSFTYGFLVKSLRKNDKDFIELHRNHPIKDIKIIIISEGKGFVSIVYKAIIVFTDANIEPYSTILKVPGTEANKRRDPEYVKSIVKAHEFECDFYRSVAKTLELPVPKVYLTLPWIYGEKEGLLHMEDLSRKCKSYEMDESISISHILDVVKYFAKMHKNVLTRQDFHGKYIENQTIFKHVLSSYKTRYPIFYNITDNPEFYEKLIGQYLKIASNPDYLIYAYSQSWKDLDIPAVIVHGDLWGGNIMWVVDEYGNPTHKVGAFVDFQIMHEGSIMEDLSRIITVCTDGHVRRHLEEFIFDFYHDELSKHFKSDGMECPVTVEQIQKAYEYVFLVQAFFMPFSSAFMKDVINTNSTPSVARARINQMISKVRHVFEDVDKLAKGNLKEIFQKYN